MEVYTNSILYKEKLKRNHDSLIKANILSGANWCSFINLGSKFTKERLQTKWVGHFEVQCNFPNGAVKIRCLKMGNCFKVNDKRLKIFKGAEYEIEVEDGLIVGLEEP